MADQAGAVSVVRPVQNLPPRQLARPWIALGDGDIYQIGLFQSQAAERGIKQDDLELAA